jgi:hypothetical protein
MNLLARILSHGFAFTVVALLVIVLMYRGEFPAWDLPEFLVINDQSGTTEEAASGTVDRVADATRLPPVPATVVTTEPLAKPLAPIAGTVASDEAQSAVGLPAAEEEPAAVTATVIETGGETAAEATAVAETDEDEDSGAATGSQATETDDAPSITPPVESDDNAAQTTDEVTATLDDGTADQGSTPVDAPQETTATDSSADSAVQAPEEMPMEADDDAADESGTTLEAAPATADADSSDDSADQVTAEAVNTGDVAADDATTTVDTAAETIDTGSSDDSAALVADDTPPVETAVETINTGSSDDGAVPVTEYTPADTDDAAADVTTTTVEAAAATVTDKAVPAETIPAAADDQPAATADSQPASGSLAVPATEAAPQGVDTAAQETPYEVMAKAREAFWLRDFELAEQQYRKLTVLDPDNPDGYGEMGNMYFSQGKWDESATAYYEAGTRLLKDGLVQQARQMAAVIRGLNGPQADDLEAQIDAASASTP